MIDKKRLYQRMIFGILILASMGLLAGCQISNAVSNAERVNQFSWVITQSPLTGRYYEMSFYGREFSLVMGMSEVTEAEYENYLNRGNK